MRWMTSSSSKPGPDCLLRDFGAHHTDVLSVGGGAGPLDRRLDALRDVRELAAMLGRRLVRDDEVADVERWLAAPAAGGLERVAPDDAGADAGDPGVEHRAAGLGHSKAVPETALVIAVEEPVVERVDLVVRSRDEAVERHGEAEVDVAHARVTTADPRRNRSECCREPKRAEQVRREVRDFGDLAVLDAQHLERERPERGVAGRRR
jgi:hypothetical protein